MMHINQFLYAQCYIVTLYFHPPDPLLSHYTPCHYILDKGLRSFSLVF